MPSGENATVSTQPRPISRRHELLDPAAGPHVEDRDPRTRGWRSPAATPPAGREGERPDVTRRPQEVRADPESAREAVGTAWRRPSWVDRSTLPWRHRARRRLGSRSRRQRGEDRHRSHETPDARPREDKSHDRLLFATFTIDPRAVGTLGCRAEARVASLDIGSPLTIRRWAGVRVERFNYSRDIAPTNAPSVMANRLRFVRSRLDAAPCHASSDNVVLRSIFFQAVETVDSVVPHFRFSREGYIKILLIVFSVHLVAHNSD